MAAAKMNVFHWHLVDDDSFSFELASFPNVTEYGAFSAEEVYTVSMVHDMVNYAARLGVRVIPEIDNPGHIRAIGFALRDLVLCFDQDLAFSVPGAYLIKGGPSMGVLDPSR